MINIVNMYIFWFLFFMKICKMKLPFLLKEKHAMAARCRRWFQEALESPIKPTTSSIRRLNMYVILELALEILIL